jgi:DNA-directed RNA polymerase specialized sigma24 family protein
VSAPSAERELDAETLRRLLDTMLAAIPAEQRAHMTVRLLSELEYLHYAAGVQCPNWIVRTRAEFAAFGDSSPLGEPGNDGW